MIHMNLQYFGGRGGAGGKRTGSSSAAESTSSIISRVSDTASKSWGESYVPLTAKQVQNLTTKLENFNSTNFTRQQFTDEKKRKVEGLPGQFRFIDYGNVTGGGRYEVNFLYGGITHAAVGDTPKEAIATAQSQFKEVMIRETLYKKRKK